MQFATIHLAIRLRPFGWILRHARGAPNLTPYGFVRGLSPAFEITGAASGDARKRIRALAAAGSRTLLVSVPAKKIVG